MEEFIKTIDELPEVVKILLCLPGLDVVWWIYRIIKSLVAKNDTGIIIGVLVLFVGIPLIWLFDLICMATNKKIMWFD